MCGIVGLFLKNPALRPSLGRHLSHMLVEMTERGPDSAGIAVYPKDGSTPTTLLSAADRALYAVKAHKASVRRRGVVPISEWTNVGVR